MRASLQYRIGRFLIYLIFKILFGLKIEGVSNIPEKGPVIIAPNHRSNYDPPLAGCCVDKREIYYFAKKDLFVTKPYAWLLKSVNVIPVDVKTPGIGSLRKFVSLLKKGKAVMLFPEGTRSKTNEYLKAQPGVGFLSIRTKAPIVPTLIEGTHESMLGHFFRISPLRVTFGDPIYPETGGRGSENARKLSERILDEVKGMA